MTIDTDIELQKTFHEVVMKYAQDTLKTGGDWAKADQIIKRGTKERDQLRTEYDASYNKRIKDERQRLRAGSDKPSFEHPTPNGVIFNKDAAITKQAELNVKNTHQGDLQRSRDGQQHQIEQLMVKAQSQGHQRGKARDAFSQAVERSTPERRR